MPNIYTYQGQQVLLKSLMRTPPSSKSFPNNVIPDFSFLRPSRQAFRFSFISDNKMLSFIPALLLISRPSTIFRRVIAVIVNTIKRSILLAKVITMLQIRFVHFISKFLERLPSAFNTSPTISLVNRNILIVTTRKQLPENSIYSAMSHPVSFIEMCHWFLNKTAQTMKHLSGLASNSMLHASSYNPVIILPYQLISCA